MLLCHMGLYWFEFEFGQKSKRKKAKVAAGPEVPANESPLWRARL